MKSIKQIRESNDRTRSASDKLEQLVIDGLLDESKLVLTRRALKEDNKKLTNAEKNALNETINVVLSDKVLSEARKKVPKDYLAQDPRFGSKMPSDRDIPQLLILKRKAIRIFPDNAKVALYYAQGIDRYVSIPFGEVGVSSVNEQLNEEQSQMEYKANRNKILEKVKQLKESNDTLVESDIKSKFAKKLNENREQLDEALPLVPLALGAGRLAMSGARLASPFIKKGVKAAREYLKKRKATKAADKKLEDRYVSRLKKKKEKDSIDTAKKSRKERIKKRAERRAEGVKGRLKRLGKGGLAFAGAAGASLAGLDSGGKSKSSGGRSSELTPQLTAQTGSSWQNQAQQYGHLSQAAMNSPEYLRMLKSNPQFQQMSEDYDIKTINSIKEDTNFYFEDGEVIVTPKIANKIYNIYESVNKENKKKIEKAISESAESFRKIINFASRY